MTTKKGEILPNDHIHRVMIVEDCDGCNKVWSNGIESFCKAYANPAIIHRKGCALKSNKEIEQTTKKKINPLKASKRGRR